MTESNVPPENIPNDVAHNTTIVPPNDAINHPPNPTTDSVPSRNNSNNDSLAGLADALAALPEKVALAVREAMPTPPKQSAPAKETVKVTETPTNTEKPPGSPPEGMSKLAHWWFS